MSAFAALEAKVNDAVAIRLTNRMVTVSGVSVRAIFDNEFGTTFSTTGAEIKTVEPRLQVRTLDLPANVRGTNLVLDGVNYKVISHQPDGSGWSQLIIERA